MKEVFGSGSGGSSDIRALRSVFDDVIGWFKGLLSTRLGLYLTDLVMMKFPGTIRHQQLSKEHLICRFCGDPIPLLGSWKCGCGFKRPGNYFGRCPKVPKPSRLHRLS